MQPEATQDLFEILNGAEREVAACEAAPSSAKPDAWDVRYRLHWIISRGELAGTRGASEETLRDGYARIGLLLERLNRLLAASDAERHGVVLARAKDRREAFLRKEYARETLLSDLKAMSDRERFVFVEGFLDVRERPAPVAPGTNEMSGYTPADPGSVLEVVARLPRGSVLFDCGSGLGLVSMLYSVLTGDRSVGVERDPVLCARARAGAQALGLTQVEFILADAREADYGEGDAFFFYNPFQGSVMREVLRRIELVARQKQVWVFGLAANFESAPWLVCEHQSGFFSANRSLPPSPVRL